MAWQFASASVLAPTDLSVKKDSANRALPSTTASCSESVLGARDLVDHPVAAAAAAVSDTRLNVAEVSAIRQLIAGYRESAAFLIRSADELQQLIIHQNNWP